MRKNHWIPYKRQRILAFALSFGIGMLLLIGNVYLMPLLFDLPSWGPVASFLLIVPQVIFVAAVLPILMLKGMAYFSRDVEADDSTLNFRHFADEQPEPRYGSPHDQPQARQLKNAPRETHA